MKWGKVILWLCVALWIAGADAHSGRTDKNGCHMDRKTGIRHCH